MTDTNATRFFASAAPQQDVSRLSIIVVGLVLVVIADAGRGSMN